MHGGQAQYLSVTERSDTSTRRGPTAEVRSAVPPLAARAAASSEMTFAHWVAPVRFTFRVKRRWPWHGEWDYVAATFVPPPNDLEERQGYAFRPDRQTVR
jgi:hypothetical protein